MKIRDLTPADIPAITRINQGAVPAVGSTTEAALTSIADESVIALVAEEPTSGEIAGFCLVLPPRANYGSANYAWFEARYDSFIYLDRVAISPRFARQGIGQAMYDEVERRAAMLEPRPSMFTLEVNIEPRNDASLAFHQGRGFAEVGQRDTDYGVRVTMMSRSLHA